MRSPHSRSLRRRVLLTLLPLLLVVIGLGAVGTVLLWHVGALTDRILRQNYPNVAAMERLDDGLERIDASFDDAMRGGTALAEARYRDGWAAYDDSLRAELRNLSQPGEAAIAARLSALTQRYRRQGDAFFAGADEPTRLRLYAEPAGLLATHGEIKEAAGEIRRMNEASLVAAGRRAEGAARASARGLAVGLALAVALGALTAWLTSRSLVQPIKQLTRSVLELGAGDLEQRVDVLTHDELGELAHAFNRMAGQLRTSLDAIEVRTGELRDAEAKYRSIVESAVEGIFQSTREGRYLSANDAMAQMLGYASGRELVESIRDLGEQVYADRAQRQRFLAALDRDGVVRGFEAECVRRDGRRVWLRFDARAVRDAHGALRFYEGFVSDVTARLKAEQEVTRLAHLQAVVADLGQRALQLEAGLDLEREAVQLVAAALEVAHADVTERLADGSFALRAAIGFGDRAPPRIEATGTQLGYAFESDRAVIVDDAAQETRFSPLSRLLGEQLRSSLSVPIRAGRGAFGTLDVHARASRTFTKDEVDFVQSVANVLGAAIERRRAEERLERVNRAHRALSGCNHALVRATDERTLMSDICHIIVEEAGFRFCWLGCAEDDERRSVVPLASAGFEEGYLEHLQISWGDTERGRGPTGTCIRNHAVVLTRDIADDPKMTLWREEALRRGYSSSLAIPVAVNGSACGALNIYSADADAFAPAEVALLTELASDLAYGLSSLRARLERDGVTLKLRDLNADLERRVVARTADLEAAHEREARIGARIQQELLLDEPPRDCRGLRLAALTVPSQRVAGDFYGFFRHEGHDCLDLMVADVMGKGVPAALLGAATKSHFPSALWSLISGASPSELPEPREIVTLADTQLCRRLMELESFVTLCYARIDVARRRLDFVDCGHTGLLRVRGAAGTCDVLHGDDLPLGVREGETFGQVSLPIEVGDLLVFYSDGVTEARSPGGEMFGVERLVACALDNRDREPEAFVKAVRAAVVEHSGSDAFGDDLTCVVAKLVPHEAPVARALTVIGSALGELRRARAFVEGFCRALPGRPFGEDGLAALVLAVDEAASNVMKHAYHGRTDQRIDLAAEAFADRVAVRLRYLGGPFDPARVPPPSLDGSSDSGFGVFLITQSVDAVRYYEDDLRRRCIRLEKLRA